MLVLALLLAQAAPEFTDARAEGSAAGPDTIRVELSVRTTPGGSVIAHLLDTDGGQESVAMAEVSSGLYSAFTEIGLVDMVVVFEAVSGTPASSTALSLTEMGLDRALLGMTGGDADTGEGPAEEAARNPWWLVLAAGAVSGGGAAVWLLVRTPRRRGRHSRAGVV